MIEVKLIILGANYLNVHRIIVQLTTKRPFSPFQKPLKTWAKAALHNKIDSGEVTLRIVDLKEMQHLNFTYRKKNKPTNVLSFPYEIPMVRFKTPILGDIILCSEVIKQEALEQQKLLEAHWAHMVIHGCLHLLGYDHEKDDDALRMEHEETQILHSLGFSNPYHHEGENT